ncbi:acyl-CoA synthetase (NDP forming) [Streptosporangium becharense]|uniref:Acyl-CoA synthetase (NDP forming) n=1 Tax=Streptosporangium becharense TaxID=1816182 RepID=A0A7W9IDW2_9ACTN|nr:acetate--CoA ligase family protein [Streptosporangium becharense]MBB2912335.1 acyl-CoA synthetase (NDP forming) [Streptosporangium becharense]MBB5818882.1 acyl-CoA synthetase (NDP forming) [Streptosporangium becharense]
MSAGRGPYEHEVKALLREHGVAVPRGTTAGSPREAGAVAATLTSPLVLKAFGPGLVHKSDAGAVRLGLTGPAGVERAAAEMLAGLTRLGVVPGGFLVEEQMPPGVELIVGVVCDPGFGPVLLAGLGGVWTEVLDDTALRLCPISTDDARRMLASLRGAPLLHGHRGRPPVDVEAVVRLLLAVGGRGGLWERLELGEFELNPVIATGDGAVAVDARHLPTPRTPAAPDGDRDLAGPREDGSRTGDFTAPREDGSRPGDFTALFEPRAVAVVGASTGRPNFGNMFLEFYKATGVPLVAVHPEAAEVGGVPAVPTLADADVDYALVAVPAGRCAEVVRQATGVPFVQVMSGGFGEAGEPGLEAGLVTAAREAGTRLLGPNCMGVYSPRGRQTFVGGRQGPPGRVALISQSGGLAGEVIKVGERRGLAFSRVATVGNAADVTPAELLRWLATDEHTSVVGMYLEDPRDGRALFEALAAVRGRLPVVLLTGGRSGQGRRAAASHTGGMAGDGRVWRALAEQTGAALVTGQDDLVGTLSFFQSHASRLIRPAPGGSASGRSASGRSAPGDAVPGGAVPGGAVPESSARPVAAPDAEHSGDHSVLVVGPSGGASVLAADAFDAAGLELAPLPDGAAQALGVLGGGVPGISPANPLEIPVGPRTRPELAREVIAAILARRPYTDVVAHVNAQSFFTFGTTADPLYAYARELARAQRDLPGVRITLVCRNGECAPYGVEDRVRAITAGAGIPLYRSMESAAVAVAAARRFVRGLGGQ